MGVGSMALMQPYFVPYIGYFQLIRTVDLFVVYDGIQYIREGWINRNRILLDGRPHWLTLPVERGALSDLVSAKRLEERNREKIRRKILTTLRHAYGGAPFLEGTFALAQEILAYEGSGLLDFLMRSLTLVCRRIGIETPIVTASSIERGGTGLSGQDRVLGICRDAGAARYVNSPGGTGLYDGRAFAAEGIELLFLKPSPRPYSQGGGKFVPGLSILDVLMWNDPAAVREMLGDCRLESAGASTDAVPG